MYDPDEQSTPAYPGDASDESALSDLSDPESDFSDSSGPARGSGAKASPKGRGKAANGKGKGKGKAGFAGRGRRLADGADVDIKPARLGDVTSHIGYVDRNEGETDEEYDDRCYRMYHYDKSQDNKREFQKKERKLKQQLGRKLTNGEKNHIRLVKVGFHLHHSQDDAE